MGGRQNRRRCRGLQRAQGREEHRRRLRALQLVGKGGGASMTRKRWYGERAWMQRVFWKRPKLLIRGRKRKRAVKEWLTAQGGGVIDGHRGDNLCCHKREGCESARGISGGHLWKQMTGGLEWGGL